MTVSAVGYSSRQATLQKCLKSVIAPAETRARIGDRPFVAGHSFSRLFNAADVQFALGEWNLNIRFPQRLHEAHRHLTFELKPIFSISPEAKLKVKSTIAKTDEIGLRFGTLYHSGMRACHFE